MTTFYRTEYSKLADQVDDALDDMVIAHKTFIVTGENELPDNARGYKLPVLLDNGDTISGEEELKARLKELKRIMKLWDKFKSDACFIDDDGTTC
ncbi:MAG TPA: hypothetical protein VKA08_11325 [Balneolales bacterium]|nr:hypothetical protein [Balneolales bacterium]